MIKDQHINISFPSLATLAGHVRSPVPVAGRRGSKVVMPIGQAMICDLVPEHERGTAFGIMKSVCSVLCLGKSMGKAGKSHGLT